MRPGVDVESVERVIEGHLEGVRRGEAPAAEIERSLEQKMAGFYTDLESLGSLADQLSMLATYQDDPTLLDHQLTRYRAVGARALADLTERRLTADRRAVVVVAPEGEQ